MTVMDFPSSPTNGQQTTDGRYYFDSSVGSTGAWRSTPLPVGGLPAGSIMAWGTNTPPANWLLADGSAISRSVYSSLFAVIGTQYGTGDGSTTFNLPDLRGRVPVGKNGGSFGTLGATGGAETVTLTQGQMPVHSHTTAHVYYQPTLNNTAAPFPVAGDITSGQSGTKNISTGNAGSGEAHNNLQPYQVVNYIIKASAGWTAGDSELATRVGALETADATTNKSGLVPIIPTSLVVAGGSASANSSGRISFTNVTSLGLRDVFLSSSYTNFHVVLQITGVSGAVGDYWIGLGNGGTRESTVNYQYQGLRGYGTTVQSTGGSLGAVWAGQAWAVNANSNAPVTATYTIGNPNQALSTGFSGVASYDNGYNIVTHTVAARHNISIAYSDFFLFPNAASFSGNVQVYGYR